MLREDKKMGGMISAVDALGLLQEEAVIQDVKKKYMEESESMKDMAEDLSDDLASLFEEDPAFRKQLLRTALSSLRFRKKVVKALFNDFG